eukprot:92686-Amorphochlora_amoeboformis.AAC.2
MEGYCVFAEVDREGDYSGEETEKGGKKREDLEGKLSDRVEGNDAKRNSNMNLLKNRRQLTGTCLILLSALRYQ